MKMSGDVLAVWLMWTGVMFLNVYLEEVIGRELPFEYKLGFTYKHLMHVYNWMACLGWALVFLFISDIYRKSKTAIRFSLFCAFVFYITMGTRGFVEPNMSWRQLELAERSVNSGGEIATGCFLAPDPQKIQVQRNVTYYILSDKEWHVDWERRWTRTKWGWTWLSAPIVYNGPVKGCKFDPPIYAGCIVKGPPTLEKCFFKESTSAYTIIRKWDRAEYIEPTLRWRIPYSGPSKWHYVMEWNSPSRYETQEYVNTVKGQAADQWRDVSIMWFTTTGAVLLVAFIVVVSKVKREFTTRRASLTFAELTKQGALDVPLLKKKWILDYEEL